MGEWLGFYGNFIDLLRKEDFFFFANTGSLWLVNEKNNLANQLELLVFSSLLLI